MKTTIKKITIIALALIMLISTSLIFLTGFSFETKKSLEVSFD